MSDVMKLDNEARKQFAANTQGISLLRLTPMFSHAMPGDSAADYLNIVMGSIPDIGASWDKWMASESAQNLMAKSNAVAECTFKFAEQRIVSPKLTHWTRLQSAYVTGMVCKAR